MTDLEKTLKKKTLERRIKFSENLGMGFFIIGIIGLFASIWVSGWTILRVALTSLFLLGCSYVLNEVVGENKKKLEELK